MRRTCSSYAKSMEGRRGAKWVRKLGGGGEDKGGDLLPKLLLTPLLPALCLLVPNLLWALLTGHPQVIEDERRWDTGPELDREQNRRVVQSATSPRWVMGGARGHDLQTQWSERFRLETMRTFPAAFKMGIAQHTTRGEDRPLLSPPIVSRTEEGF